jgi:hypothetical protein
MCRNGFSSVAWSLVWSASVTLITSPVCRLPIRQCHLLIDFSPIPISGLQVSNVSISACLDPHGKEKSFALLTSLPRCGAKFPKQYYGPHIRLAWLVYLPYKVGLSPRTTCASLQRQLSVCKQKNCRASLYVLIVSWLHFVLIAGKFCMLVLDVVGRFRGGKVVRAHRSFRCCIALRAVMGEGGGHARAPPA